jgi:hypothetical protein
VLQGWWGFQKCWRPIGLFQRALRHALLAVQLGGMCDRVCAVKQGVLHCRIVLLPHLSLLLLWCCCLLLAAACVAAAGTWLLGRVRGSSTGCSTCAHTGAASRRSTSMHSRLLLPSPKERLLCRVV